MPPQARCFGAPVCFQQDTYLCQIRPFSEHKAVDRSKLFYKLSLRELNIGTPVALHTTMTALAPEVTAHGLALWRLHRSPEQRLHCLVGKFSGKLVLAIHSEGKVLVAESHSDIVALVKQAEAMKASYIRKGWDELEVERDDSL